jgi:hypothetical protein
METQTVPHFKLTRGLVELWASLLVGPIAALTQLESNYALVLWACNNGQIWPLHLVSFVALLVTVLSGFVAYRNWRQVQQAEEDAEGPIGRGRLMCGIGVLVSSLMSLVILAQWLPTFIYGPCQR